MLSALPLPQHQYDSLLLHPGPGDDASLSPHLYPPLDVRWRHQNPVWQHRWVLGRRRLGDLMRTCSGPVFWPSGITLVALLVPITLGIYVKRRWPEKAKKILKVGPRWGLVDLFKSLGCRWKDSPSVCCAQVGSIAGFGLIIILAVVGGVLYQSSWVIAPSLWIIGTIYPFIGFGLGFMLARITGQPWYR